MDAVEENLDRDPLEIALDKTLPHAREVATRVKYLRKARTKLPSYYEARCIVPGRAYEQSSGERSAMAKGYSGRLCIDLTCGLGVDSYAFSHGFERVIAVEPDPVLAETARYNFGLLGAGNIEVVNSTAEEFIAARPAIKADLVYLDPDRRKASGQRVVSPADSSPDVLALLPHLKRICGRTAVKLSPMFDIHEVFRVFGTGTRAIAVSDGGECKEVLVETGSEVEGPVVVARMVGRKEFADTYTAGREVFSESWDRDDILSFEYLAVPDVSLLKTGLARCYFTGRGWTMPSGTGYAFSEREDADIMGRLFRIVATEPYSPKRLKPYLRDEGIRSLDIMHRDFPLGSAAIAGQLGIKEGGRRTAALTVYGGRQYLLLLDPV